MREVEKMMQLQQQNRLLRQEVQYWKAKYYNIQKECKQFFEYKENPHRDDIQQFFKSDNNQFQERRNSFKSNDGIPTEESEDRAQRQNISSPNPSNDEKDLQPSLEAPQTLEAFIKIEPELDLSLITGCFVLEKRRSSNYNPVKLAYPSVAQKDLSSMYDTIYRFVFIDEAIQAIIDDEEQSRKNQIFYGSKYEDFHFVFDDYKNQTLKNLSNPFLKEANMMRKQHVFGIVRPQILLINDQYYQTQIAFGFTSQIPIYPFFKDLNRVIQQQIKLTFLNGQKDLIFQDRLEVISSIITNICNYSINNNLFANSFPINLSIEAPLCTISLKFSSLESFILDQLNCMQVIIQNYPKKKIIKILHYLLAEKSMVIICKTRKSLNQLFQILKVIMQPLNWIFPIVYSYTPFYEPFLSSPLPILVGYVKREYYEDWEGAGDSEEDFLPPNDLILIKAETQEKDCNQISSFQKRMKKCEKWTGKDLKEDAVIKEKLVPDCLAKKIAQNKLCFKLHYYVQQLLNSTTAKKQEDSDDFFNCFKESQMLSYYRQE